MALKNEVSLNKINKKLINRAEDYSGVTLLAMLTPQNCCKIKGMVWGLFSRGYRL